jgi:hypothetical protein
MSECFCKKTRTWLPTKVQVEDERKAATGQKERCEESPDFWNRKFENPREIEEDSSGADQTSVAKCRLDKHSSDQCSGDELAACLERAGKAHAKPARQRASLPAHWGSVPEPVHHIMRH